MLYVAPARTASADRAIDSRSRATWRANSAPNNAANNPRPTTTATICLCRALAPCVASRNGCSTTTRQPRVCRASRRCRLRVRDQVAAAISQTFDTRRPFNAATWHIAGNDRCGSVGRLGGALPALAFTDSRSDQRRAILVQQQGFGTADPSCSPRPLARSASQCAPSCAPITPTLCPLESTTDATRCADRPSCAVGCGWRGLRRHGRQPNIADPRPIET